MMTPEEKAVIQAALGAHECEFECPGFTLNADLFKAVRALIDSRITANAEPNLGAGDVIWRATTWGMVLYGDEVRLPGRPDTAMMVTSITPEQLWHVKDGGTGKWWDDVAIEHIARTARMLDRNVPVTLPPETPIEICMDAERRAAYVLQQTFPGSEKLSS